MAACIQGSSNKFKSQLLQLFLFIQNPALCARLVSGHQKLLISLALKLQLKTEIHLGYFNK